MSELDINKLKNIWNSIFDTQFLTKYTDEEFASIFMLLDALKFHIINLISKRQNCCNNLNINDQISPTIEQCKKISETFENNEPVSHLTPKHVDTIKNNNLNSTNSPADQTLKQCKEIKIKTLKDILLINVENDANESVDVINDSDNSTNEKYLEKSPVLKSKNDFLKKRKRTLKKKLEFDKEQSDEDPIQIKNAKTNVYTFKLPKRVSSDASVKNKLEKVTLPSVQLSPQKENVTIENAVIDEKKICTNFQSETFYQPVLSVYNSIVNEPKSPGVLHKCTNFQSETFYQPNIPDNLNVNESKSPGVLPKEKKYPTVCTVTKLLEDEDNTKKEKIIEFDNSFDCIPGKNKEPDFAYRRDAVRKKAERAKLMGRACKDCEKYYEIMGDNDAENLQQRLNKCSRHRDNYQLSFTPPGFWNPLFTQTQKK